MRKVNPTLVGAFVLGAIGLVMAIVILFSGGRLFQPTLPVIMEFHGSVKGLQPGSQISFRGVPVGKVTGIQLTYDVADDTIAIPVEGEMFGGVLNFIGGNEERQSLVERLRGSGKLLQQFIDKGLRAQLSVPNFVTNQVDVTIDFFPNVAAVTGPMRTDDRLEIPTVPSEMAQVTATLQNLLSKLSQLPLDRMIDEGQQALAGVNRLVNDPQMAQIIANANQTIAQAKQAVNALDARLAPILGNAQQISSEAVTTVGEANRRLAELKSTIRDVDTALGGAQASVGNADKLLSTVNGMLAPGSPLTYELINTLREVASTARSARALMNTIERDPNALLVGRPASTTGEAK